MKVKPVGKWLLLRIDNTVLDEMAKSKTRIILTDAGAKSVNSLNAATVLGAGDETTRCATGDTIFYRFDSPAIAPLMVRGEQLWLLPEEHIMAKWVTVREIKGEA